MLRTIWGATLHITTGRPYPPFSGVPTNQAHFLSRSPSLTLPEMIFHQDAGSVPSDAGTPVSHRLGPLSRLRHKPPYTRAVDAPKRVP